MSTKSMTGRNIINGRVIMAAVMLAIFTAMITAALAFPGDARLLPWVIGIPGTLMALAQLINEITSANGSDVTQATQEAETPTEAEEDEAGHLRRETTLIGFLFLLVISHLLLGFLIASPLFVATFLIYEKERWLTVILSAVGTWAVLYVIFNKLLTIHVFEGLLTTYVMDMFG